VLGHRDAHRLRRARELASSRRRAGRGGIDPCSFYGRAPYQLDCGYLWTVYYNNGDANAASPFFDLSQPETLISPVELESYLGDGTLAVANRGLGGTSWTNHAVQDFNGDGILDVGHTMNVPGIWSIWRGTLVGGKLAFDRQNVALWASPFSMGDSVAQGNKWRDGNENEFSINVSKLQLLDLDGNGRLDLVNSSGIHWNKGNGFPGSPADFLLPFSEFENRLSQSTTEETDGLLDGTINSGERFACIRSFDYDHDGRPDFMECRKSLTHSWDPRVGFGLGDQVGPVLEVADLLSPDDAHGHFQIVEGESGSPNTWKLVSGFMDLDGDGLEEDINFNNTFYKINGEPPGTPPIRAVIAIDNGRGLVTSISYAPHVDESVVEPGNGRLPKATWVVKSIERIDAHGAGGTTELTYRGPVFNADDDGKYGFRGFDEARTKSPLGALTVNRYDYDLDWSGRLVETLVFESEADYGGDPSTSSVDEAVSITRVDWRSDSELCDVYGGAIELFLVKDTDSYTCSNGQSIDDCLSNGAMQRRRVNYRKLPSSTEVKVCRTYNAYRWSGPSKSAGDSYEVFAYDSLVDEDDYRIRTARKITREYLTTGSVMVAREDNVWSADLRTLDKHKLTISPDVQTINFTYDDLGNLETKKLPDALRSSLRTATTPSTCIPSPRQTSSAMSSNRISIWEPAMSSRPVGPTRPGPATRSAPRPTTTPSVGRSRAGSPGTTAPAPTSWCGIPPSRTSTSSRPSACAPEPGSISRNPASTGSKVASRSMRPSTATGA
jgi:hypothetical protein